MNFVQHPSKTGWRAHEWIRANPDAWRFMVNLALQEAKAKRRFSARWLMEQARRKDFVRTDSEPFKINNSLAPAFARILIKDYPEVRPFVETRRAACDGMI